MFESIINFFKKLSKKEKPQESSSTAKERLHLVLMQDRANVSADFLELMRQEIIEVIKKYIDIDEAAIDVKLTNKTNDDGTVGAPALYANIPIITIKNDAKKTITQQSNEKKEASEESKAKAVKHTSEKKETASEEGKKQESNKKASSKKEEESKAEEKKESVGEKNKVEEEPKVEEKQEDGKEDKKEVKETKKQGIKKPSNNQNSSKNKAKSKKLSKKK